MYQCNHYHQQKKKDEEKKDVLIRDLKKRVVFRVSCSSLGGGGDLNAFQPCSIKLSCLSRADNFML